MKEIWIETGNMDNHSQTIIAISNKGRILKKSGEIRESKYGDRFQINGKRVRIYKFIAEHFILKTQEDLTLGRNMIDHKTHNPDGININDVRNLRWCTNKENSNFDEARKHKSESHTGLRYTRSSKSEFGRKFKEHYGIFTSDNINLYQRERRYYKQHKRCSWE